MKRTASLQETHWYPRCAAGTIANGDAARSCKPQIRHSFPYWVLVLLGCTAEQESFFPLGVDGLGGSPESSQSGVPDGSGGRAESTISTNAGGTSGATSRGITIDTRSTEPEPTNTEPKANCGSVQVDAEIKTIETVVETPGNVLFVFDQSSSMSEAWQGTPKWQAANDAVVAAFTPLQDKLSAGAVLFPTGASSTAAPACDPLVDWMGCIRNGSGQGVCAEVAPITSAPQLKIQPGSDFLNAWKSYWTKGEAALGIGTPTEKGLQQAEAALANPPTGNTAVVLVTDGEPTCGANESAIAARLLQKNIKTYVTAPLL